jgi:hypothetical protein
MASRPPPPFPDRSWDEVADRYQKLRKEARSDRSRWLLLIKELRARHGLSILEAERLAVSNTHRRHWVEKMINTHQECRKAALAHIRYNGEASLIKRIGDSFEFRVRA